MKSYPSLGTSLWRTSFTATPHPSFKGTAECDVVVIGGGIAGLTTAYLLSKEGRRVILLEADTIGSRVSGYTTAKVTVQHAQALGEIAASHGDVAARDYLEANKAGLEKIADIVKEASIECDWRQLDNYVFTNSSDEISKLKKETELYNKFGVPAEYCTSLPIAAPAIGAVKVPKQATFHIMKYLAGLARAVELCGGKIYEHSKVTRYSDGESCVVQTASGAIAARDIVIATNAPSKLKDHAAYGLLEYPVRSYIVAGPIERTLEGMYISTGSPTRSVLPLEVEGKPWVLVGGEGHFVGMNTSARRRYNRLAQYGQDYLGLSEVKYSWSTWDFVSYDDLPIVGKLYPWSKHAYVITGLRKWGMTNATAGAQMVSDLMADAPAPWHKTFDSTRSSTVKSLPKGLIKGIGYKK
ncbi:FAD-binding oxidoreductase [Candidatus Saccharibacteria bacterium]|nr:FAD-binding oxidoreductase [Candidatus Saccharibacteria bacterium]